MVRLFTLFGSLALLQACAANHGMPTDYRGRIATQTPVESLSKCISRSVGATRVESVGTTVIESAPLPPLRRYTIQRIKEETVVIIEGAPPATRPMTDPAVVCAATLANPSSKD